jgi:RNA polymerase sigma-70 factor (ECF subfamily)
LNTIDCVYFPAISSEAKPTERQGAPEAMDFRQLTEAVRRGDEAAFNQLHAHFSLPLFQRLLRITRGDETLARELAQTSLLKLAQHAPICDCEAALHGWLWQVARRSWLDLVRQRKRYEVLPSEEIVEAPEPVGHPLNEVLQVALGELPPDARELLQSFYIDERPLSEIAAERGLTYKAAESRLSRLRAALRERILQILRHEN